MIGIRLAAILGRAAATLLLAVTIAFLLTRISGDPARAMLGDNATADQLSTMHAQLGLDRPLVAQYLSFIGDLARGDLGTSLRYGEANLDLIVDRSTYSVQLASVAIVIAVLLGVPLGVIAALREGGLVDRVASAAALLGQSIPLFWLGQMLVLLFAVNWGLLPAGQATGVSSLVLPAITLAMLPLAHIARLTRSGMSEVMRSAFVMAARARGLPSWRIVLVHALRSAALPVVTVVGLQLGVLISSAVAVELVFAWPGLGSLATEAVERRDFPLVQAVVVAGAAALVLINLTVDILYTVIDPRVRDGRS